MWLRHDWDSNFQTTFLTRVVSFGAVVAYFGNIAIKTHWCLSKLKLEENNLSVNKTITKKKPVYQMSWWVFNSRTYVGSRDLRLFKEEHQSSDDSLTKFLSNRFFKLRKSQNPFLRLLDMLGTIFQHISSKDLLASLFLDISAKNRWVFLPKIWEHVWARPCDHYWLGYMDYYWAILLRCS